MKIAALALLTLLGAGLSTSQAGPAEVRDSRGKFHRVPSIEYRNPSAFYGILPAAWTTPRPWQLVNPLAPAKYGYGRNMVSWNSREGKPKGFIALGFRFW